jgi:hypothetical protein
MYLHPDQSPRKLPRYLTVRVIQWMPDHRTLGIPAGWYRINPVILYAIGSPWPAPFPSLPVEPPPFQLVHSPSLADLALLHGVRLDS